MYNKGSFGRLHMLQKIQFLLGESEEAILRLNYLKSWIYVELDRQAAEEPWKTMGAKKQKVLFGLGQVERKTILDLDQYYCKKIFVELNKPAKKKRAAATNEEANEETKYETLFLVSKRFIMMLWELTQEPF